MRFTVGVWTVIAGLLLGSQVAAAWTLEWNAPAECGDEAGLRAQVAGALPLGRQVDEAARVAVRIELDGGVYRARLTVGDAQRSLENASCPSLVEAVGLVVALSLPEAPPPPAVVRVAVPPPAAAPRVTYEDDGAGPGVSVWAMAGIEHGAMPTVTAAGTARLALVWDRLRVEGGLMVTGRSRARAGAPGEEVGAELWMWAAQLGLCYGSTVYGCLGGELGAVHGTGLGVQAPLSRQLGWQAGDLALGARVTVGPAALVARFEVGLPAGGSFRVSRDDEVIEVHRMGPSLRLMVGAELSWGK